MKQYQIQLKNKKPFEVPERILADSLFLQAIRNVKKEDEIIELDIRDELFLKINDFLLKIDEHKISLGFDFTIEIENQQKQTLNRYMSSEQFKELFKDYDIQKTKELLEISEILDIPILQNIFAGYFSTLLKDKQYSQISKLLEGEK